MGAAAVAGMREAMRQVLTRRAAHREQPGPQHGTPLPRRARSEIQAGPDGWHLRVELPGAPPGTVALWLSGGRLAIAAAGSRPYAARLLLPLEADPASLRWHCEHGLLQAHLAPHRHDAEPAA